MQYNTDQTTIKAFYRAIRDGMLPVVVPIEHHGETGIATLSYDCASSAAQALVWSCDPTQRVIATLHALHDAAEHLATQDFRAPA